MKTTTRKVYQCEHCKKNMLSAGAMARHEKYCRHNPHNMHRCFDLCKYLHRQRGLIPGKYPGSMSSYATEFLCQKIGVKMYSYLAEKKASSYFGCPMKYEGLTRMPLACIHFEYMNDADIEKRFGSNLDD